MRNEALLQANLHALRRKSPDYADVLSSVDERSDYVFEKEGSKITCRDQNGNWVCGPDDPQEEAQAEAARLTADGPVLHIVLRPCPGYLSLAIQSVIASRRCESVLLLAEDRLDLLKAVFARIDWTSMLGSRSVVLLLGDPHVTLAAFFEQHPAVSLLPISLVVPPDMAGDPGVQALGNKLVSFSENTQRLMEAKLGATVALISRRRERREPPRVLLTVPEIGYLAGPIADGFRACGAGVELQPEGPRNSRGVQAHDWLTEIPRFAPDLVLWMNRPELSRLGAEALRSVGAANVHWSVDSPRRMLLTPAELELVDVHLCFDANYLGDHGHPGPRISSQLSLGAGIEPLPGCRPSDAAWPERLGPDVTFVGSLGETRVLELRELLRRLDPDQLAVLDEIAHAEGDPAALFQQRTGRPYQGGPCLYVDEARSTRRRLEVLSALPRASLKIFGGTEWVQGGRHLAPCYGGHAVPYGFDLSSFYYHSKINVNVFHEQCIDSTNSRVYDVLAAGGFLLTEYRPRIAEEFEIGRHLVTFSTPAEAREKVEYYFAHPSEREAIAREGQRHVLAHHTFRTRCQRILELARPDLLTARA